MPKSNQDDLAYTSTYLLALKILSQKSCNTTQLRNKLMRKTNITIVNKVLTQIEKEQLIDNQQLCVQNAIAYIEKKPISKTRLTQKLMSFGFQNMHISKSFQIIETMYHNKKFVIVGGLLVDYIQELAQDQSLSLWDVLALAACILMYRTNNNFDEDTAINRLALRGFNISPYLRTHIATLLYSLKTL